MQQTTEKPVWGAPERNKQPIYAELMPYLTSNNTEDKKLVLEVGSGTGQHAVYFASKLPHVLWQCTDQLDYLSGITQWVNEANLSNLPEPLAFNVIEPSPNFSNSTNELGKFDLVYSANTLHIMSWNMVESFFAKLPTLLKPEGILFLYGPFNYAGEFTSQSNAEFDASLKQKDPAMGIRDVEAVIQLANHSGLRLLADIAMPANNRSLVFTLNQS